MKKRNIAFSLLGGTAAFVAVKFARRAKTIEWETARRFVTHADRSKFIEIDGARVHYQEFGSPQDPAMILVHGYTASVYVWSSVAPQLAERGFRVIAVDLIGFGYSEKPAWFDYTIASQARMISHFMDAVGLSKATLVGSSYGGAVVSMIALDEPERVEKLVLVDAVCNDEAASHPLMRLVKIRGLGELMTTILADSPRFFRRRMRANLARSNHHLITDERVAAIRRPLAAADGHRSVLATSRAWYACRVERDAHKITSPTLIIWGDSDNVIKIHNGYSLHEKIPGSRFVIFRDCGHVASEEKSELFVEVVAGFARQRPGAKPARSKGGTVS